MTRLRDGSSLLVGERRAVALGAATAPKIIDLIDADAVARAVSGDVSGVAVGEHGEEGEPGGDDATTLARLEELDRLYVGWIPGFLDAEAERLASTAAIAARRRVSIPPRLARPTLPSSIIRRARAIEAQGSKKIFLNDDADGLGFLLAAGGADVTTIEPHPARRAALQNEAARGDGPTIVERTPDGARGDAAVIAVGPPHLTASTLDWACRVVEPGGLIYAQLRAPWEEPFFAEIDAAGLELVDHLREIDHAWFPGGFAIDGGTDLVILRRTDIVTVTPADTALAAMARAQPYYSIDVDELRPGGLGGGALERFADLLAAVHPVPETMRAVVKEEERELATWFDEEGVGLTVELQRGERHAIVTFQPYDVGLEWAALLAAFHTLGDPFSRVRPLLTTRWRLESIVA